MAKESGITRISRTARELKRRKVFRVGSVYLVSAWGLSMGASELLPTFGVSEVGVRFFIIALFVGLPIAILLSWVYELGPEGIKIDQGPVSGVDSDTPTVFSGGQGHLTISVERDGQWDSRTFTNSFTIGRNPSSDICIDSPSVSRRHARVIFLNGEWMLEDLGSRNGTKLNGEQINKAPLPAHGEVRLSEDSPKIIIKNHHADLDKTVLQADSNASAS